VWHSWFGAILCCIFFSWKIQPSSFWQVWLVCPCSNIPYSSYFGFRQLCHWIIIGDFVVVELWKYWHHVHFLFMSIIISTLVQSHLLSPMGIQAVCFTYWSSLGSCIFYWQLCVQQWFWPQVTGLKFYHSSWYMSTWKGRNPLALSWFVCSLLWLKLFKEWYFVTPLQVRNTN
jgi:hypothetical protein